MAKMTSDTSSLEERNTEMVDEPIVYSCRDCQCFNGSAPLGEGPSAWCSPLGSTFDKPCEPWEVAINKPCFVPPII